MKRRILAVVLIMTILISVAPMTFALEIPDVKDIDTRKLEISIKALGDLLDSKLNDADAPVYDAYSGEYDVNCGSYYVSLGDSSVIGMKADNGNDPEGYSDKGYKTVVPASFPYRLAKMLGLDIETQYIQLALAGMRTNDLRYVLDESFVLDAYGMDRILERIDDYAGGVDAMRADYRDALAKADLVTLSIGNNNISYFLGAQFQGMVAELLRSSEDLMNLLNSNMGTQIRPMVELYLNLDATLYELDWNSYIDAEGMECVKAVCGEVKSVSAEVGIPEVYTVDVGEMIQPMLDEQFGEGFISLNILLDIPLHQLAADMMEYCLYGYITHVMSYSEVVDMIHEMSDAEVVLLSLYNPMDELVLAFEDMEIHVGEFMGKLLDAISKCGVDIALHSNNTVFASLNDVESNLERIMKEEGNVVDLTEHLTDVYSGRIDYHATVSGHTSMAEHVYNTLVVTESGHTWNNSVCSVCGAAKGDEGGEHDNCVADIFSDIKAEAWYHDSICYVYNENLMKGMSDDKFSPSTATSRAMIVTTLYRMEGSPAVTGENSFDDVKAGAWYADAINWASENGIVNGLGNGIFGPNKDVTREQLAAMLYRYAEYKGMDVSEKATLEGFTDVGEIHGWALDAMKWANAAELINGRSETTINPLNNTMRSELATLLYRWNTELAK